MLQAMEKAKSLGCESLALQFRANKASLLAFYIKVAEISKSEIDLKESGNYSNGDPRQAIHYKLTKNSPS